MVNSIRGTLTFKSTEQLGIETGGVEWAVDTTSTTLSSLPGLGEQIKIFTHLHHTQDQMRMYGFFSTEERNELENTLATAAEAVQLALSEGVQAAANSFNTKKTN